MEKENNKKSILGFSIGDVNGIGPEILIKSLSNDLLLMTKALLSGWTSTISPVSSNLFLLEPGLLFPSSFQLTSYIRALLIVLS